MRKIIALAVAALFVVVSNSNAQATFQFSAVPVTPGLNLIHCPGCGDLDVWQTSSDAGDLITTLEIQSKSGSFRGAKTDFGTTFSGLFDVYTPNKAFKLFPEGFGGTQTPFGNLAGADNNWTFEQLAADLIVSGSFKKGGAIEMVTIVTPVPEPAGLSLLAMAGLPLLGLLRRK